MGRELNVSISGRVSYTWDGMGSEYDSYSVDALHRFGATSSSKSFSNPICEVSAAEKGLAALMQLRAGLEVVLGALRSARSEKQILAVLQAELKAAVLRQGARRELAAHSTLSRKQPEESDLCQLSRLVPR